MLAVLHSAEIGAAPTVRQVISLRFELIAQSLKDADFAYFDDNHDGRVSRDEFVRKPNPLFARYDRNGDCRITPEELKGEPSTQPEPRGGKRGPGGSR